MSRRFPDKYLAISLFLLLLGLYLWTKDDAIKQMMATAFGVAVGAIAAGLRRVDASFDSRLKGEDKQKGKERAD